MLNRLIHRFLLHRHFWREANFAELAELYATRLLRMMAVGMIAVFVGIYLLRNGYSVPFALAYFSAYFGLRALFVWPAAHVVARYGPKHGTLMSNLLYVPALLALAALPQLGLTALVIFALFQSASVTLYDISYNVNFSKVKISDHAGKELGFVYIMTKIGGALSPLIGGAAATLLGAESTIILAALLFVVAALPLFFTPEPTKIHQALRFEGLRLSTIRQSLISNAGVGVDMGASGSLWSIFVATVVLAGSDNSIYLKVGALSSLTVLSALISARIFGLIIDRRKGGELLMIGAVANSLIHLTRPFVTSLPGVAGLNVVNELATTGYSMPYVKGMCDEADSLPGYRIVYLSYMSLAMSLGAALIAGLASASALLLGDVVGLKIAYVLAGVLTLPILAHGFRALGRAR